MMATSSDEIIGEVSSKSVRLSQALRLNSKKIEKKKEIIPNIHHVHHQQQPLTANLSTWSRRRRMKCIQLPVADYLKRISLNKTKKCIPGTTLCSKCGVLLCQKNTTLCNSCLNILDDSTDEIPKTLAVKHCQGCKSYSFTGRADFVPAPLQSTGMLRFLLRRIEFQLFGLQLKLIDVSFLPTEPNSNIIRIDLLLEKEAVNDGAKLVKRHVIDYIVEHQTCHSCLYQDPASQCTTIVQLRQCVSDKRSIRSLIFRLGKRECELTFNKCKIVPKGLDVYFDTNSNALAYFNLLCSRLPVRPDELAQSPTNVSYIPAMLCPISQDDLIYLRSNKVLPGLGSSMPPLMICTKVSNSISLLDPFTVTMTTVSAVEYWSEPTAFEIYKNYKDFVEYIVLDVKLISKGSLYSLAEVDVARIADFGKNDIVFTIRTHLSYIKPGDHAYGYDLFGNKNSDTMMGDASNEVLPDVVLIKKKYDGMRPMSRKNTSPEYEEFLRDLEENPEAMFSLSLNGENNKAENQQSKIASIKEGKKSGFDLEGLLADLVLGDQQDVGASGRSDEHHR